MNLMESTDSLCVNQHDMCDTFDFKADANSIVYVSIWMKLRCCKYIFCYSHRDPITALNNSNFISQNDAAM